MTFLNWSDSCGSAVNRKKLNFAQRPDISAVPLAHQETSGPGQLGDVRDDRRAAADRCHFFQFSENKFKLFDPVADEAKAQRLSEKFAAVFCDFRRRALCRDNETLEHCWRVLRGCAESISEIC